MKLQKLEIEDAKPIPVNRPYFIKRNRKYIALEFKVWGYRNKCKARIENSLKVKGIKKATWNRETKILTVLFNPEIVLFEQIQASFSMVAK